MYNCSRFFFKYRITLVNFLFWLNFTFDRKLLETKIILHYLGKWLYTHKIV